ncbi:MAG TPA: serine hydrolase [Thermoanaerobaculia bacterium]|jgi:CubicO group peptidase (beta-lactamase class C family)
MRTLLLILLLLPTLVRADDAKRRAIETNLTTPTAIEGVRGKTLEQRMKELGVPAVSYAVVEDGKIVLAAAVGLADVGSGRAATPGTLFQAASISKPVAAIGAMELVERGKLPLDAPVNTILRSWKLPENELTAKTPVSVRLLLSHAAGTTVHGFPGYAFDEPRPTLVQLLDGKAPTNTAPIVVDLAPNTKFRYSGGGTSIVQAAISDATGLPFPLFMRRTVLDPLNMTRSTYEQPLPRARHNEAATAYRVGMREVEGKFHLYPEMAAAGLWTTPSDLARVIIEMQNALAGRETKVLTIDGARHMLTPRFEASPRNWIGIGFFIEERGGARYFGHGGANEGFRATLLGSLDGRQGAVVMTNSDTGGGLAGEVLETIAREYRWPGLEKRPLRPLPWTAADADRFAGRYRMDSGQIIHIRRAGDGVEFLDTTDGWLPMYLLPDNKAVRITRDTHFEPSAEGLTVIARASTPAPARLPAKRLRNEPLSGIELLAMGRVADAMNAYREEFRADPKPLGEEMLIDTAFAFSSAGRMTEALALVELGAELHPASARARDRLAEVLMIAGQNERAIQVSEEALRLIDSDANLKDAQKETLRKGGQRRLAKLRK